MEAAEALNLTSENMQELGLVDGIIPEPLGGAHSDPDAMFKQVKKRNKKTPFEVDSNARGQARGASN
jgi:acetyl-CoA carboxylase carboxyl transferase subunit alpha